VLWAASASLAGTPEAPAPGRLVVLDTTGFWRMHHVMASPVMQADGALKPIPDYDPNAKLGWQEGWLRLWHGSLLSKRTAAPPAEWTRPDFDDSAWVRGTAASFCHAPYLARLCLRGKFTVTEPAKVRGVSLSLGYHGGAVVYLNGRQVARQHLPKGADVAEAYGQEAFVDGDGKLITLRGIKHLLVKDVPAETVRRIEQRVRTLEVAIPGESLRAGLNVIAIELVRAPYHKVVKEQKVTSENHGKHEVYELSWNTCELRRVQLTAASPEGLVPNATRPRGLQVWNSDAMAADFDLDFGDPAEPLRPIRLLGVRNGTFSGKVVVGSDKPIRGLLATPGDLTGENGKIAASQVGIRYALPWGEVPVYFPGNCERAPYPAVATPLLALAEAPLNEFPVRQKPTEVTGARITKWGLLRQVPLKLAGQPAPVFGAVVPIWVTVKVPTAAAAGDYAGRLTIQADGKQLAQVPVELKVVDWALPDSQHYATWVELIQSPDTLALEYGLPAWSDRHAEMIAKSMDFLRELGSSVLFVPLIAQSNAGNEHTMVRWVSKGQDKYDYDFAVMERYLDLAEAHMGKPKVVVFNIWDRYLMRKESGGRGFQVSSGLRVAKDGPIVSVLDASGKLQHVTLPDYTYPQSKDLWKPLFEQLRRRMAKRGLEKAMMLGLISDFWPTKEQIEALNEITGDLPWANAGHYVRKSLYDGLAKFGYQSSYFGVHFGMSKSLYGWKARGGGVMFDRVPLDTMPLVRWRHLAEQAVTGTAPGVGRLGADTWRAVKDKRGNRKGRVWERYPGSNWGYLNCDSSTLAPGPAGPVATARFEALREGVQECEAVILIERALTDKALTAKLGEDLAARCQQGLDERRLAMWRSLSAWQSGADYRHEPTSWRAVGSVIGYRWFLGSGWQQRSEKLYALAGEVAKTLGRDR